MDSFEINKIIGALLGVLLVVFVINLIGDGMFPLGETHKPATHEPKAEASSDAPAASGPAANAAPVALTAGDATNGAKVFKKCAACHSVDASAGHKIGPNLNGVVGRDIGKAAGFSYSAPMAAHGGAWGDQELSDYLAAPKEYVPGNKMAFAGLKKPQDRADLIAYLRLQKP
mgnify:CR=1 FL=1